jgi:ABC-type microcin C transport system permease subunit YejE
MPPQPAHDLIRALIRRKDGVEHVLDPLVAHEPGEALDQPHAVDLEGRQAQRQGEGEALIAQHLERQVQPLRRLRGLVFGIVSGVGPTAIVLKSQALSVSVKPIIDAARIAGGNNRHIIFRHLVPKIVPLAFLYMMFTVTTAIALEATLSFFGLLDVPMSWGIMIHTAQVGGYLLRGTEYWWLLLPAGVAVTLFAAAFYFVGRALDEVVNPRLRRR